MEIHRVWSMPNSRTFSIKPIAEMLGRYVVDSGNWVDPFAGDSLWAGVSNDLDPKSLALHHEDALDFLRGLPSEKFNGILFDPPYSTRQVSECYRKYGRTVNMETTQASFWTRLRAEAARIVTPGGIAISFGWNSGGLGKCNNCEIVEILLVPHGGIHNDTIVTVEKKLL